MNGHWKRNRLDSVSIEKRRKSQGQNSIDEWAK
jgi:hypothetical protein